jgi:two-component system sensor histidine kinase KdpD
MIRRRLAGHLDATDPLPSLTAEPPARPRPAPARDAGPLLRAAPSLRGGGGERLLALIGPDPGGERVARHAKQLSEAFGIPWMALHIERPGCSEDARAGLEIAAQLGGEVEIRAARNLPNGVLAFAALHDVSSVVMGQSRRGLLAGLYRPHLATTLIRQGTGLSFHVVADPGGRPAPRVARERTGGMVWPWLIATALVAAVIVVGHAVGPRLHYEALGMLFLAAVVGAAALYGLAVALYASLLGFFAWVVLFIPPVNQITIYKTRDVLAVFVFVGIAAATGWLASRVRAEARVARGRLDNLRRISVFSRKLAEPTTQEHLLEEIARQAALIGGQAVVLTEEKDTLTVRATSPGEAPPLDRSSRAAARWTLARGQPAGRDSTMLSAASWLFLPLRTVRDLHGALGIHSVKPLHESQRQALSALADQAAAALERVHLTADAARNEAHAETQKLRTALLNSLSHDLRTPLTSIRGAAGTLRGAWERLPAAVRNDLLASIEEDTIRMTRFLANIMEMTRLESGQIVPRQERVSVQDAIEEAVNRVPGVAPLRLDLPPDLPPVRADTMLLEQVLVNVLENARKYSHAGPPITVCGTCDGERVRLTVADEGAGIPPVDLPHIFDSFYRAKREDRTVSGTGLGLAIARGMMEAMAGNIAAESPRPDAAPDGPPGTVVTITLKVHQ